MLSLILLLEQSTMDIQFLKLHINQIPLLAPDDGLV